MTFCKEMSSRVEKQFCRNICFLGIDTNYCSDLCMFLIRLNHQEFWQAMMPKKQKYKNTKGGKKTLQKGCLKINEAGEKKTGNQKLLPYK